MVIFCLKKIASQIGSFHKRLVLATEFSSVLTSLNYTATMFWVSMRCGYAEGSSETIFLVLIFLFVIYVFFCVRP